MYAGLCNRHSSPGCRQGNNESAQSEGPTRETGPGKTSVSILLEVGMTTRVWMISRSDCRVHRSNTPIIYRAFPVWNVRVSHIVDDLVRNNGETRWFVTVLVYKCPNSPELSFSPLFAGCRRMSVRIDSETGSPTHATGLFLGTAIGVPRSHCGSLTTLRKYAPYSLWIVRMALSLCIDHCRWLRQRTRRVIGREGYNGFTLRQNRSHYHPLTTRQRRFEEDPGGL